MRLEKPKKILVVEDEAVMREIVVRKLKASGFEVVEAGDGKEAINVWIKEKPDAVLLDLILPQADGFEILKTMRENPDSRVSATKVIVLSNLWSNEYILRAQNLKIQGYLVKAYFTTEDILRKLQELFTDKPAPIPAEARKK